MAQVDANPRRAPRDPQRLRFPDVLATAFAVAERFFRGRLNRKYIWEDQFEEFSGDSTASDVEKILTLRSWLAPDQNAVPKISARRYRLAAAFLAATTGGAEGVRA